MLAYNDETNRQIIRFLKNVTKGEYKIYNSGVMMAPPKEKRRIEFKFDDFVSTGSIYQKKIVTKDGMRIGSVADYKCQLLIRVIDTPIDSARIAGLIAGAIQTNEYLYSFIDSSLYLKNQTTSVVPFVVQRDNVVISYQDVIVNCVKAIEYEMPINYFDTVNSKLVIEEN